MSDEHEHERFRERKKHRDEVSPGASFTTGLANEESALSTEADGYESDTLEGEATPWGTVFIWVILAAVVIGIIAVAVSL